MERYLPCAPPLTRCDCSAELEQEVHSHPLGDPGLCRQDLHTTLQAGASWWETLVLWFSRSDITHEMMRPSDILTRTDSIFLINNQLKNMQGVEKKRVMQLRVVTSCSTFWRRWENRTVREKLCLNASGFDLSISSGSTTILYCTEHTALAVYYTVCRKVAL